MDVLVVTQSRTGDEIQESEAIELIITYIVECRGIGRVLIL